MLNFNCARAYKLCQLPFVCVFCLFICEIKKKLDNTKQPNISTSRFHSCSLNQTEEKNSTSAGNRTRVNCLDGSYAHHYTTDTLMG